MSAHLFPYRWSLADGYPAKGITYHGRKVFGTFICGGGSTMGYKLAGFDHIGGVEIDPKVAEVYRVNHNPRHLYVEDIRAFNERTDLPDELFSLDLLDGSPPCSSFSMAGSREKGWGKAKVFREGQAHQRLDDLVFAYVDTIAKLRPKVAILENVKGIIAGNGKVYSKAIVNRLRGHGYTVQVFLLNAATMGVPQMRERVFFIARLNAEWPDLLLNFREKHIPFRDVLSSVEGDDEHKPCSDLYVKYWHGTQTGKHLGKFNSAARKLHPDRVANTMGASAGVSHFHPHEPRQISKQEVCMIGSFPVDYAFGGEVWHYLIGMSVPPVMMAQIAHQIDVQWFSNTGLTPDAPQG